MTNGTGSSEQQQHAAHGQANEDSKTRLRRPDARLEAGRGRLAGVKGLKGRLGQVRDHLEKLP